MNEDGFGYNNNSSMRARITGGLSSTRSSCECLKSNLWLIPNTNLFYYYSSSLAEGSAENNLFRQSLFKKEVTLKTI